MKSSLRLWNRAYNSLAKMHTQKISHITILIYSVGVTTWCYLKSCIVLVVSIPWFSLLVQETFFHTFDSTCYPLDFLSKIFNIPFTFLTTAECWTDVPQSHISWYGDDLTLATFCPSTQSYNGLQFLTVSLCPIYPE